MSKPNQSGASQGEHTTGRKSQELWILQWRGVIWALIWLILHFLSKVFYFSKGWTKTHEIEVHGLDLGAHELPSSDKIKEINVQPGSNSISSYTVTPSLNLFHRTEKKNKLTPRRSNSQRKWEEWNGKPSQWFHLCPELLIGLNPEPTT